MPCRCFATTLPLCTPARSCSIRPPGRPTFCSRSPPVKHRCAPFCRSRSHFPHPGSRQPAPFHDTCRPPLAPPPPSTAGFCTPLNCQIIFFQIFTGPRPDCTAGFFFSCSAFPTCSLPLSTMSNTGPAGRPCFARRHFCQAQAACFFPPHQVTGPPFPYSYHMTIASFLFSSATLSPVRFPPEFLPSSFAPCPLPRTPVPPFFSPTFLRLSRHPAPHPRSGTLNLQARSLSFQRGKRPCRPDSLKLKLDSDEFLLSRCVLPSRSKGTAICKTQP